MRKSLIVLGVVSIVAGLTGAAAAAAPRGPAKFYDQNGGFRGYAWCLQQGLEIFDCNYFNLGQCQASASTRRVWCVQNPFAVVQGYNPDAPVVTKRKVRRQDR